MPDPLLQGQQSASSEDSASESSPRDGLYLAGITSEHLAIAGDFFEDMYTRMRNRSATRQVTRNAISMFRGAMFALASKEKGNGEWKEHCASSLREIVHEWEGTGGAKFLGDFREFYPNSPKQEETEVYKDFKECYGYFSAIGHHNASGIMGSLKSLRKDTSLKLEDCCRDDVFIETVKQFFVLISQIIGFSKNTPAISAGPTIPPAVSTP